MQFLYPGFLWGLVSVALPILIHLLQLRRPQRILFTNTGFIQELELTTMRRRRLQELWVLLARVLGIVFLVLVFAQPFVPARQAASPTSQVAVLLDTSPSMLAPGASRLPLLQEAASQAAQLGKSYGATTHFQLVGQAAGALTQAAYERKLRDAPGLVHGLKWDGALGRQQLQARGPQAVYLFSDFQRSNQSKAALQGISPASQVVLVPQVAAPTANVYVDSVWLNDAFVRVRTNLGLHIRLRNGGAVAITDCPVKVRLGRQQVAAFRVALGAGQATTTVAQIQVPDNAVARGEVTTGDSPVTFDNSYYFTLQPAALIRVLEIGAEPAAQRVYRTEALFAYSFAKPGAVNYAELRQANLVLLHEVAEVDAGLREALVGVVRRGGSVAVVPPGGGGGQAATLQLLRALGVGGAAWLAPASLPAAQEVAMPSARDPFFRDVFGAQPRQVVMPQVAPVLTLGRGGTDILRLRGGDSYLAEFGSPGGGHTYVFAAPFAKAYGDFPTQGLFVPVLYRLALRSYHTSQRLAYGLAEPVLTLDIAPPTGPAERGETPFRLAHDSLVLLPAQQLRGTSLRLELPPGLSQSGFYELRRQGRLVTTLALNADRRESELKTYSAAELRQLIGPHHPQVQVLDGPAGPDALASYRARQTGQPLWRYCLLVVLVCLLAEGLLLRFGRPRVAARAAVAA